MVVSTLRRSLRRGPALSVSGPGALSAGARRLSGPGALSPTSQRSLCQAPMLSTSEPGAQRFLCRAPGSMSGPGALSVGPRRSLCWGRALCVGARRFLCRGPAVCALSVGVMHRGPAVLCQRSLCRGPALSVSGVSSAGDLAVSVSEPPSGSSNRRPAARLTIRVPPHASERPAWCVPFSRREPQTLGYVGHGFRLGSSRWTLRCCLDFFEILHDSMYQSHQNYMLVYLQDSYHQQ